MGPTWGRQDPGKPHVGPMNLAISVCVKTTTNDNLYSNDNAVCIFVCRQAPLHKKKSEHFRATKIKVKKVFELPCKKKSNILVKVRIDTMNWYIIINVWKNVAKIRSCIWTEVAVLEDDHWGNGHSLRSPKVEMSTHWIKKSTVFVDCSSLISNTVKPLV